MPFQWMRGRTEIACLYKKEKEFPQPALAVLALAVTLAVRLAVVLVVLPAVVLTESGQCKLEPEEKELELSNVQVFPSAGYAVVFWLAAG